ncbi:MAG TPA: aldolase/citrate lyase family protein [Rhizobiaceae bacterium]|nr:aldolase/citrate lyase family protein [Rhizobiaceae bacterium]
MAARAREIIAERGTLSIINPNFPSTALVEFLGKQGFDALFVDCEHGPYGMRDVEDVRRAADATGMVTFVRVETDHPAVIVRYLDRGVDGIIVPHVETADQAQSIVAAVAEAELADKRERYVNVLVESVLGLENLAEIASVPGLTGVFFGAVDLSTSMGHKGQPQHPEVKAAVHASSKVVHDAGLMLGVPHTTEGLPDYVRRGGCYVYVHAQNLLKDAGKSFLDVMPRAE